MKKNYVIKSILTFILFGLSHFIAAQSDIRFIEVDPSTESVTIKNFSTTATIDISDYKLCIFPAYPKLNTLSPSGTLNLSPGAEVTVTSTADLVDAGGELGLYIDTFDFGNSNNIRDYVQWISSGNTRESVAVGAGIWGMGDTIDGSVTPPYAYTGDGSQTGVSSWGSVLNNDEFSLKRFNISPNPAKTFFKLELPNQITNASVQVYDVLGKEVLNKPLNIENSIDVSGWNNGIYLVKVTANDNTHTKRFIKQ